MRAPRILPLVGIAAGGLLAVKGLASIDAVPAALAGARAFAEETLKPGKPEADPKGGKDAKSGEAQALPPPSKPPAAVCAPTAAELAKQAGLSPAELQILQSLSARRGVLDLREQDLETQIALLAAAEAKLDAKIKAMNGLKTEIRGMLGQADAQKDAELARLITVYQAMKPKDAAARMTLLTDDVRLPMAAKMKERSLSAILAQMPAAEAKALTEKLAARYDPRLMAAARAAAQASQPANAQAPSTTPATAAPAPDLKPAATAADPVAEAEKSAPRKVADASAPPARRPAAKPKPKPAKPKAAPAKAAPAKTAPEAPSGPKPYASLQSEAKAPAAKEDAKPAAAAKTS